MNVNDKHPDAKKSVKSANYKIIVVEDDDGLSRLIQKKLQKEGYKTEGAFTGQEALLKTRGNENEILLIDYKLPDMTGKQLTKQIIKKYNRVPSIIVITGYGDEKIAIEMMKLGVWDYMVKEPDFIDILPEKIKHVCEDIEKNKKLKKAEDDLRKNLELLNNSGEMARVGGWEVDLEKNTVYWTQSTKKIHEVPIDYVPTLKEAIKFFPGESRRRLETAIENAIQEGTDYDLELKFISAKGKKLWVHSIGKAEMKGKKCVRIHGTFQDITRRKEAEDELKINIAILKRTEQLAHVGSWEWDVASDTVTWSDELFNIFKLDPKKGAPSYTDHPKIYTPESMQRLDAAVKHTNENGEPYEIDLEIIRGDGTNAFCTARGFAKKDKKGKVIQLYGSFQDITERKKLEAELQNTSEFLKETEKTGQIGGWQFDPTTLKQTWTDEIFRILEIDLEHGAPEVPKGLEFINPEFRPMAEKAVQRAMELGEPYNQEWMITTAKGNKKWVNSVCNPKMENGKLKSISGSFQDITDRKKAEEQLKAMNQQLVANEQQLMASNQQLQANEHQLRAANQQLQANEQELTASNQQLSASEQQLLSANQQLQANEQQLKAANQQLQASEEQLQAANQQLRANEQQLKVTNQELAASEKELKEANKNIKEREKLLRLIDNTTFDQIYSYDLDNRFTSANKTLCENLKLSADDIIGKSYWELGFPEENCKAWDELHRETYLKGHTTEIVSTSMPDGTTQYFEVNLFVLKDNDGTTLGLAGINRNITESKFAEEEIIKAKERAEESEEKLDLIIKNSNDILVLMDEKGNQFFISEVVEKITGYKAKELIGPLENIVHPDDLQVTMEAFAKVLESKNKTIRLQFRHKHKQKGYIWLEAVGQNYLDNPLLNAVVVNTRDISQQKEIESELIGAKVKAEESDRLKSAFLANMSHEIRTPMNGIIGFTSLLQEPNLSGEEQQKFIEIIKRSGDRMLNTVNDIIDISKIETGQMDISLSDMDIIEKVETQYNFFKLEAESKGLKLLLRNLLPDDDKYLNTDKRKFNSILSNLIKNAIKYTDKGSVEIGCSRINNEFQCYVKDTGIGIPESRQKAVFERFVQADIADTHAFEGSGLGLAICKAYVEMLGGKIWVESEEGVGSKFYFTIPYATNHKEIHINKTEDSDGKLTVKKGLKVLIVDDDEFVISYLTIVLEEYAKELLIAKRGPEAVEVCRDNPDIDIVLMDIKIPGINGYEATRQIRKFNKEVFILAQTAYAQSGDRNISIEAGCNDYISKPIKKKELLKIISRHFENFKVPDSVVEK